MSENPTRAEIEQYSALFVNQLAYGQMTDNRFVPESNTYFLAKNHDGTPRPLSYRVLSEHLTGESTILLYAINPETQRSKWTCLDADYDQGVEDLDRIREELRRQDVRSAIESSRRGAHLWVFHEQPVLASDIRRYMRWLLGRLHVPIKGSQDGVEIFPRQDRLARGEYGNGMRAPLGVHRKDYQRYWFRGVWPPILAAQLDYLRKLPKLTPDHLTSLLRQVPVPQSAHIFRMPSRRFSIYDYFPESQFNRRGSKEYEVQCPSCAHEHLKIGSAKSSKAEFYRCWGSSLSVSCTTEQIRAALGKPRSTFTDAWLTKAA